MRSIKLITPKTIDLNDLSIKLKLREQDWTVNVFRGNLYIEKYQEEKLMDYLKIELDEDDIDDSDCPIEELLADEDLYQQVLGEFKKYQVGFFRSTEKEMLKKAIREFVALNSIVLINNHGVIAFAADLIDDNECKQWDLVRDHKRNLSR